MHKRKEQSESTLCWKCARACGGCSWSSIAHKPVTGWTAERRDLYIQNKPEMSESYVVHDCPEYVSDGKDHSDTRQEVQFIPEFMVDKIVFLRENSGLTYDKIAERLGISQQTVRKYYHTRTGGVHIQKSRYYKGGHTCMIRKKEPSSGRKAQALGGL